MPKHYCFPEFLPASALPTLNSFLGPSHPKSLSVTDCIWHRREWEKRGVHKTVCFSFIWQKSEAGHGELVQWLKDVRADVCCPFPHDPVSAGCCSSNSTICRYLGIRRKGKEQRFLSLLSFLGVVKESSLDNMNLLFICQNPVTYLRLFVKDPGIYGLFYFKN